MGDLNCCCPKEDDSLVRENQRLKESKEAVILKDMVKSTNSEKLAI